MSPGPQDVLREFPEQGQVSQGSEPSALSWGCLKYVFNDQELMFSKVQNLHGDITTRAHHWHTIGTPLANPDPKLRFDSGREINRFEGTQWVLNIGSTRSDCPGTQTSMNEDSSNLSKAPLEAIRCLAESVLSAECAMPLHRERRWVRIPVVS